MTSNEELMAEVNRYLRRLMEIPVLHNTGIFTPEISRRFREDIMEVIRSSGSVEEKKTALAQLKGEHMRRIDELYDNPPNV